MGLAVSFAAMNKPGNLPLGADRWVACIRTFSFIGLDFTGATFAAQVRAVPDGAGSPLVDLSTVGSGAAEGLWLDYVGSASVAQHILNRRLKMVPAGYEESDIILLSVVGLRINETTMEGLPFPIERGENVELAWGMHITPSGGIKDKYLGGKFTVRPGAME